MGEGKTQVRTNSSAAREPAKPAYEGGISTLRPRGEKDQHFIILGCTGEEASSGYEGLID